MALNIQVPELQQELGRVNARWRAEITNLSHLAEDQKRLRLGAVPPGGLAELQQREQQAAAAFAAVKAAAAAAAPGAAPAAPSRIDWRDVGGQNYITPIRDQGGCGSCVAFGTIAATEGIYRIGRHDAAAPIDLSEAQLFYCHARSDGRNCGNGWWPDHALRFMSNPGVADDACYPYTAGDQNCTGLCADWQSRLTFVTGYHNITDHAAMKAWLAASGPLITCFTVYDDFFSYHTGVYHHVSGDVAGGHCVCVVGYDDTAQCWICKNSWGSAWGDGGFFRIGYGEVGIDAEMWAIEGVATGKVTLGDTSTRTPALATAGDRLALAWTGTDNPSHLNVLTSPDGRNWGNKRTLPETSFDGPGLAFGGGRLFLAWTGTDPQHHLNVVSSGDFGQTFGNKVTLGDTSRFGPALAYGNGLLFIAWVGTDANRSLNVMSSNDGVHWGNKVTLGDNSDSAPALCWADNRLYMAWQGTDAGSHLNVMTSPDGKSWGNKVTLGDTSDYPPALAKGTSLVLGWTGRDSQHHLNTLVSSTGPGGFGNKIIYGDTAVAGIGLAAFHGRVLIAWPGTDSGHHLNVMQVR